MARPKLYDESMVKIDTRIRQSHRDELERRYQATRRPVSDYVREAIELYLDPEGNPSRIVLNFDVPLREDLERIARELRFPSVDMLLRHLVEAARNNSLHDLDAFLHGQARGDVQACVSTGADTVTGKRAAKTKRAGASAA